MYNSIQQLAGAIVELTVVVAIISILVGLLGAGFLGKLAKRFFRDSNREDFATLEQFRGLESEVKELMKEFRTYQIDFVEMEGDVSTLKREHTRLWDRLTNVLDKVQENLGKLETSQANLAAKIDMMIK